MGKKIEVKVEELAEEMEGKPFFAMARKVLLAGMGALALTQEEAEKFVGKLVERGEIAEQDGKKLVRDMM
jgi:poly(hydroxyalkanoate) granule-associated protein